MAQRRQPGTDHQYHMPAWIQTVSGGMFFPLAPRAEDVQLTDIAHALGAICRYNGHTRYFLSVAEHCVEVSIRAAEQSPRLGLLGLLHDAAEAYILDLPTPIKERMPGYREAESAVELAIFEALGIVPPSAIEHARIKEIDNRMRASEYQHCIVQGSAPSWDLPYQPYPDYQPTYFSPSNVSRVWLRHYQRLSAGMTDASKPEPLNTSRQGKTRGGFHERT